MQFRRQFTRFLLRLISAPVLLLLNAAVGADMGMGRSKSIRPDKVALYIRWSTDDQATGTTLEVQTEACDLYARSQGWSVRDDLIFIDDGYSGANLDRPGMSRLRELVQLGQVDCVVVMKIDRLSRNIVDAVDLVLREWDGHCYIKSAREPIDTLTDLGRVIFSILATFADFERSQIRDRTQSGKVRRIAEGKQLHGEPAFGYLRHATEKGVWLENPDEAPLVRRIFAMAAEGVSANQICRVLNAENILTRRGNAWNIRSVLWILHNRLYIGEYSYGTTSLHTSSKTATPASDGSLAGRKGRRQTTRVTHDTPKATVNTDAAPRLIGRMLFDLVQVRLQEHRWQRQSGGARAVGSPHLLVGIARCACGAAMVSKIQMGRRNREAGKEYRHYICSGSRAGTCTMRNGHADAASADASVEQNFLDMFRVLEQREELFAPHLRASEVDHASLTAALKDAQADLKRLDQDEQRLRNEVRTGEKSMGDVKWIREGIESERISLVDQVQTLRAQLSQVDIRTQSLQSTLSALRDVERWDQLDVHQRRQLLRMVLADKVVITKPKGGATQIEMRWAF